MRLLMRTDARARWLVVSMVAAPGIAIAWYGFHQLAVSVTLLGAWLGVSFAILLFHRMKQTTGAWFDGGFVLLIGLGPLIFPVVSGPIEAFARKALPVVQGIVRIF